TSKYADVSKAANILWRRIRELCHAMETYGSRHGDVLREPTSSAHPKAGSISANSSATSQQAPPSMIEAREETFTDVGDASYETELGSLGASLGLEFSINGDNSPLQDVQAWGLPGWPSNSHSYLFQ
ncbi:hypothetical protein EDB81DRAFT_669574, partial [Dactylonectria macrodidyma]